MVAEVIDPASAIGQRLSPSLLGFSATDSPQTWTKSVRGRTVTFRTLESLEDLTPVEDLQRVVMGSTELDTMAANMLVVIPETGGIVIGAFVDGEFAGASTSFGGFIDGKPRLISDFMAIYQQHRSAGLGAEMKKLQAALALERGFEEIVWTVDPLRAPNARLNFEKLGATCHEYLVNRYGEGYGAGIYGVMPTDRLHMSWNVASSTVSAKLMGQVPPLTLDDIEGLSHFHPSSENADRVLVYLPADIDSLLAADPNAAYRWRLTLRDSLQNAFEAGFEITGFVAGIDTENHLSTYVLTRQPALV